MDGIIQKGRQNYLNDRPEDSGEYEVYEPRGETSSRLTV